MISFAFSNRTCNGIEIGSNGETGMTEIVPRVGKWHCHATPTMTPVPRIARDA